MIEKTMPPLINPRLCVVLLGKKTVKQFGDILREPVKLEVTPEGLLVRLKAIFRYLARQFSFLFLLKHKRRDVQTEQKAMIKKIKTENIPIAVCSGSKNAEEWITFHYDPSSDTEPVIAEKISQYIGEIYFRKCVGKDLNLVIVIADLTTPEIAGTSVQLLKKMRDCPFKKAFIAIDYGTASNDNAITNLFVENGISPILMSGEAITNNFYHLFGEIPAFLSEKYQNHFQKHPFSFSEFLPSPYDSDSCSVLCSWRIRVDPEDDESIILKTASKAIRAMLTLPSARSVKKISNFEPSNLKGKFALVCPRKYCNSDLGNYGIEPSKVIGNVDRFDLLSNSDNSFVWAFGVLEGLYSLKSTSKFEEMLVEEVVE